MEPVVEVIWCLLFSLAGSELYPATIRCYPAQQHLLRYSKNWTAHVSSTIYQVLRLPGVASPIYLSRNQRNRGEDGQGFSETLMCRSSNHTHTGTHTILTLPQIGLSLWSNEKCDVWGRSGWKKDRRSERLRVSWRELCRGSWGGCLESEWSWYKPFFLCFLVLLFRLTYECNSNIM